MHVIVIKIIKCVKCIVDTDPNTSKIYIISHTYFSKIKFNNIIIILIHNIVRKRSTSCS